jgi:hypothetical protein
MLNFKGEIVPGDAEALQHAILTASQPVMALEINSPGGNPFEALRMSDVINKYFVSLFAGNGSAANPNEGRCASACALIFLTADQRAGSDVYLHRPTFPRAMFRSMSAQSAHAAYESAVNRLQGGLRQRGVPETIIEQMMDIPSEDARRLEQYPTNSPWMDEWIAAKCGVGDENAQYYCWLRSIQAAQKQAQRLGARPK